MTDRLDRRRDGHRPPRDGVGGVLRRLALAATLVAAFPVASATAQQPEVVRHLGLGDGKNSIGVVPTTEDVEGSGPSALYAAPDGKIYLLDQVNGRILAMDGSRPDAVPESLKLPDDLVPQDLVAVKDTLYVWDGRIHALGTKDKGDAPVLEARAVSSADDATRSAFAQMGSQEPSSTDEVISAAGRAASSSELGEPIRQHVASQALGAIDIEILPRKDAKSAVVEMRLESAPLLLRRFEIKVADRLGAVEILDVSAKGDAFVFTESIPLKAGEKAWSYVVRYGVKGRLDAVYDLPITGDQFPSRRFVTVTPQGKVLYLRSDATGVSILDLKPRSAPKTGVLAAPPVPTTTVLPTAADTAADLGPITAIRPGTRLGAIQTGLAFEGLKWTVTPQNYGADPDKACVGFDGRTRRPAYLTGQIGKEVRGVPYCWGCFGSFVNFKRQVDRGVMAGNWCTRENPRRDVVGVDCSAFVSQCWGLARQYTTADIPSITERLANPWDLKPGDALNKAGSHVMLFVKFTPDRKVEVLEASTGGCNGRVCRNVYPLSVLLARGYAPVRYKALRDQ